MGGRYIISGVQIGEIKALAKSKKVREIIEEVYEDQFLGDSKETIQELKDQRKRISNLIRKLA